MTLQFENPIAVAIIQRRHQYGAVLHHRSQSIFIIVLITERVNITAGFFSQISIFIVLVGDCLIRVMLSAPGFHAGIVDIGRQKLRRVIGNGFLVISVGRNVFRLLLTLFVNMVVSLIVAVVVTVVRVDFLRFFRFVAAVSRSAVLPNIL